MKQSRLHLLRWIVGSTLALVPLTVGAQQPDNPHGPKIGACSMCHRPAAWTPVAISKDFHHAPGVFPLEGAHATAPCTACHRTLDFAHTSSACASCHTDVHHGEFGTQCARCHTTRSFVDPAAMRRMHDATLFPLRGAHAVAACEECHLPTSPGQSQYANRPTTCYGCHATEYRQAKNPDHVAADYPQVCSECHGVVSWQGAAFNHNSTGFPLTGAHLAVACNACHGDGVYKGKSTACASCHLADYNATNNPAHAAAGFPQTCDQCHTTATWAGATFDHDSKFFPIYSGTHQGRWSQCSDCHTTPSNYAAFTCMSGGCHGKSSTDASHSSVSGYVYQATACYACHPRGSGG